MLDTSLPPAPSAEFLELEQIFHRLQHALQADEVVRFNLAYSRLYPRLSRDEKHRSEALVDHVITALKHQTRRPKRLRVVPTTPTS